MAGDKYVFKKKIIMKRSSKVDRQTDMRDRQMTVRANQVDEKGKEKELMDGRTDRRVGDGGTSEKTVRERHRQRDRYVSR